TSEFYFIEVNPRIQVEHTVTEVITGIDIVKSQILIALGAEIGMADCPVPEQKNITMNGHALQCRLTTENPENNFIPDYGRINAYRSATGFGIRLDGGTAYSGAQITPFYDSMLVKITAFAPTPDEAIVRMKRALDEFRIRGVATNLQFLTQLLQHPKFLSCEYTTKFIDQTPELFDFPKRRDTGTRLLSFIGDVMVNGNKEVASRPIVDSNIIKQPVLPEYDKFKDIPKGTRDIFLEKGASGLADWLKNNKKPMITDTTMRDAHQSLLATRFRTYDLEKIAPYYAHKMNDLFSVECWGGATFDVAMRFLNECPWHRLESLREKMPNQMLQMLLRASNAVGYANYPDNAVKYFIERTADTGLDIFRVFDSLNWTDNMKVAIDMVLETGKVCEGTICYTGDIFDKTRDKYNLDYYVNMAKEMEKMGTHIIALKDMAGLLKPHQTKVLIKAIKDEVDMPIHLHTHDTSGVAGATYFNAIEAGVDVVDCAMDSMSGLTSQPALGSIVEGLNNTDMETGLNVETIREASGYWGQVRRLYQGFEADNKSGASEVYLHEMPGGQFTNLKEQASSLGIGDDRWHLVAQMYAKVNEMFGDIVKVTPSSKVVGDMAIMMVTSNLTVEDVLDPNKEIAFPESVVQMMRGELGIPKDGFPKNIQDKVLKGEKPMTKRYGEIVGDMDLKKTLSEAEKLIRRKMSENELASYIMYPKVFEDYAKVNKKYANVDAIPTYNFFYGMEQGEEINIEIEKGKTIIVKFLTIGDTDKEGMREVFFEINGQPRIVKVIDKSKAGDIKVNPKAEDGNMKHIPAPMPGMVVTVDVAVGQKVHKGEALLSLEAMKMQTAVSSEADGVVKAVHIQPGDTVSAHDLLIELE
ncbi:MAG: pyruvate carboxylase, partial [Alphaproteobacteria bacterium]